jgi:superfamily II DNA or RNA helicase
MSDSSVSTVKLREQLAEAYYAAVPIEQYIVQLLSIIYEPVGRTSIVICLNHLGAQDQRGKPFSPPTLKPYIDSLIQQRLLIQEGGQGVQCHPLLVEVATRNSIQVGHFESLVQAVQAKLPIDNRWKDGPRYFRSENQFIREVRVGIYRHDLEFIGKQFEDYARYGYPSDRISIVDIYQLVCNNPFDPDWFQTLPPELQDGAIVSILNNSVLHLTPAEEAFAFLQADCAEPRSSHSVNQILCIEQMLLRNKLPEAERQLECLTEPLRTNVGYLHGWLAFMQGEDAAAIAHYTEALQNLRKTDGKRKAYFQSSSGLWFVVVLLWQGSPEQLAEAASYTQTMAREAHHWLRTTYARLNSLLLFQQGDLSQKGFIIGAPIADHLAGHSLETLLCALCLYWIDAEQAKRHLPRILEPLYEDAEDAGYLWLAMETAALLARLLPRSSYKQRADAKRHPTNGPHLVDLIQPQEPWELSLKALANLTQAPPPAAKPEADKRLAWFVTYYPSNWLLQPREQALSAKGGWGKGRNIALKRLKNASNEFDYLTPQDHKICAHLKVVYSGGYYGQTDYSFGERAIVALIGHPLVFWEDAPTTRVEVVKGEPELLVKKGKGERLILQFSPELKETKEVLVLKESPTRLKVIEITPEHRRIAEILGKQNRLEVPAAAKERVLAAISAISRIVTIHSDIGGDVSNAEEVAAEATPHVHLLPVGAGLKVAVLARPIPGGSYYHPGSGGETVIAEIEGKRLHTTRNLQEEKQLANAAIAACPTLVAEAQEDQEWLIEDPEACLELLLELQALGESIRLEWPQGEKLRVSHHAGLKNFQLTIKRQNDWFATSGELKLSDELVLDMQRLMELLSQTSSRFVPLGDGQFLALTEEFRKRLDELRAVSEKSGKGLRIHPLAAVSLEDWMEEVGDLKADKHWKAHIQRLKEVQNLEPGLPSTLQADLRDYQLEGFRWLARLAHWGVGACLADDMGLGKTLQALALILTRAPQGATLIVAPTSVCMNWIAEAQRFAPTLRVLQFGGGNRQKMLDELQPFDMLVCSYGLLQQEEVAEMLAKVTWETIVLDEAQSIKNFATKRSQAAMNLQGNFKLLTTGTPIENHLGELWNLFRFINPGLLGSLESFNQRFAVPIERYQDKAARQQLKKLIQPFLLRRTKNQVLEELPSRTEIVLHVELSQAEMAFYEALRRDAVTRLTESDATAGAKHLQVLAEIMKLRRACCNVQLVTSDLALPSAKLQLFGEVLTELLENRHKALVFSQFVDHLHLLRAHLEQQQISYQYLDGSTPAPERKKRVDAFQAGEGDVFLISLKAGGTGLNLTAADYVIHMDPWWNPAVEDQASDRAHRIGQQRPVTIYRLVAKNTIEEKIVELHHHKRDLADSLLEGAEVSGKISTEDLLRLMTGG